MKKRIKMKKLLYVIVAALCLVACEKNTPEGGSTTKGDYVDLGLTSGTKWKAANERNPQDPENGFYTYDEALGSFGNNLPTNEQWMELVNECTWTWTGMGYKIIGSNGNSITLSAAGYYNTYGVSYVGSRGFYWSSTPNGSESAWHLYFESNTVNIYGSSRSFGYSVRLVR